MRRKQRSFTCHKKRKEETEEHGCRKTMSDFTELKRRDKLHRTKTREIESFLISQSAVFLATERKHDGNRSVRHHDNRAETFHKFDETFQRDASCDNVMVHDKTWRDFTLFKTTIGNTTFCNASFRNASFCNN